MNKKYSPVQKTFSKNKMSFEKKTAVQTVVCLIILVYGIFVSKTNILPSHKHFFHRTTNITWDKQNIKDAFSKGSEIARSASLKTQSGFDAMIAFFDKGFGSMPKENTVSASKNTSLPKNEQKKEEQADQKKPEQIVPEQESDIRENKQPTFRYPLTGEITSYFGSRTHPLNGNESIHYGVDIAGNYGDCVISSLPGVVTDTGVDPNLGNYIKIRHSENMETVYGHLSEILVRKDETVDSNTRIGSVGSTGAATGPHVHLEVRIDGECQDPMKYLAKE